VANEAAVWETPLLIFYKLGFSSGFPQGVI
jgi:hypothetical protein